MQSLSRAAKNHFAGQIEERILHTGQHYDANMSQVFFDELGIPQPDYNLGVGSGSHGVQTAKMISGIEEVLTSVHFDGIILYGDTNSTLAGAVAASKIHIPVFHIEAGLRSFNMTMPEEVNRIVCDQLSSICFSPTQTGVDRYQVGLYAFGSVVNASVESVSTEFLSDPDQWTKVFEGYKEYGIRSKTNGFVYDKTRKEDIIAAVNAIYSNYSTDLMTGTSDPDVVIPKMKQELIDAGIYELIDDIQSQLDEHLASTK